MLKKGLMPTKKYVFPLVKYAYVIGTKPLEFEIKLY